MKRRVILSISCSVLAVWACSPNHETEALDCVDSVFRLEESGAMLTDERSLAPALALAHRVENPSFGMKLWYCLGRIQTNNGDYDAAAVSLQKAAESASLAADRHLEGLVYRAMADVYNHTGNIREDTLYLAKAAAAFVDSGDSLHAAEVELRLAAACYNNHEWECAERIVNRMREMVGKDRRLHGQTELFLGSFLLDAPDGRDSVALLHFRNAKEAGAVFSVNKLCDWGYALFLQGKEREAISVWDSLEREHPEGIPRLDYRKYCLYLRSGNRDLALRHLEKCIVAEDSLFRTQASEAVSRAQRDYMEAVAQNERLEKDMEREARRSAVAWGALGIALLVLSGVVVLGNERARRVKDRQALADARRLSERLQEAERQHLNRIHSLERDVRKKQSTLEEVRSDYLFMFRSGYRRLGNLFEARHFAESQKQNEKVLCQKVAEILREIDGDRKGFRKLRKFIEDNLDKPISHLISDIPGLKEVDVQLFCYLVIGYDASLISLLMGIDSLNTVYSRKNRLVGRIKKLPPAKARRYLDLIA